MSKDRFKSSSYTDLTTSTVGSLGYLQIRFQSNTAKRAFYLSNFHKRCDGDTGWLVVKEDVITKPCKVDQVSATTIWYSGLTTKDFFNDYFIADFMTVEVNIDVTCDNSRLQIDNAVFNVTGNQFNDTVTYTCLDGFNHTYGDLYRRCNHLGYWTGTSPTCTITCNCSCGSNKYININDTEALKARLEEIKSKLSIKASETSKARRLKVCAKDERTSAKAVGSILGGLIIGSFVLTIVLSDLPLLLREIKKAYRNIRS
ncbi:uncharacterized protein LOC128190617 [Crassostrea angulata]|uniref:uncharacterized protein LOC128190617 n=1 Tax=Magallana angulata TaxID=2784310 RepID=UPI0022B1CB8D|nr:uncharacterized protein LOC128190617 [Crassostrea angulata]